MIIQPHVARLYRASVFAGMPYASRVLRYVLGRMDPDDLDAEDALIAQVVRLWSQAMVDAVTAKIAGADDPGVLN